MANINQEFNLECVTVKVVSVCGCPVLMANPLNVPETPQGGVCVRSTPAALLEVGAGLSDLQVQRRPYGMGLSNHA